jgi:hypothetical protein
MPQNDQQFLWVKMPDGSYGKFNAGTPDATIRATILKNFPNAFKTPASDPLKTGAGMMEKAQAQARPSGLPEPKPGALSAFGETTGMTSGTDPVSDLASQAVEIGKHPVNEFIRGTKALAMTPVNLAYSATHHPIDTATTITGGPQFAEGVKNKNLGQMAGALAGGGLNTYALARGMQELPEVAKGAASALTEKGMQKVTVREGARLLADRIASEELSPGQYGENLQEGFDHISDAAGAAKREVVNRIQKEAPNARIDYKNTLGVLNREVQNLQFLKDRNPALFSEGEGLNKTLTILQNELDATNREASAVSHPSSKNNIATADERRSQYFLFKDKLDPSMARRVIGSLNQALAKDVEAGVGKVNPQLAKEYLDSSSRYRELKDLGRNETLKKVFGDKRVVPDKVVRILSQAPEESLDAIKSLYKENPQEVQQLRRSLFEYGVNNGSLRKIQPSIILEVYGPQAEAVNAFIEATNPTAATTNPILAKVPGKVGAAARFVINASKDQPAVYISGEEMAKILKSANMTRVMTQAAKTPADAGPANMMRKMVLSGMVAAGVQPEARAAQ